jgi:S-adenosylmethionine:tRNA ribosyltransferase-isomerase
MDVSLFDFDLPEELIALRPASPRDSARLLVVDADGALNMRMCAICRSFCAPAMCVVVNDTKVIAARLRGRRLPRAGPGGDGPAVEVLLHKRLGPFALSRLRAPGPQAFERGQACIWANGLQAQVLARGEGGEIEIVNSICAGAELDRAIAREGEMPLPPYIAGKRVLPMRATRKRLPDHLRRARGLGRGAHGGICISRATCSRGSRRAGVARESVTLHVGAGTFLPVSASDTAEHACIPNGPSSRGNAAANINGAHARAADVIVAVGTTSLRTLESAADEDGRFAVRRRDRHLHHARLSLQAADVLLTNFHLPRSTLFMLVCAFMGTRDDETRLCGGDRGALSLLLLWRCVPVDGGAR